MLGKERFWTAFKMDLPSLHMPTAAVSWPTHFPHTFTQRPGVTDPTARMIKHTYQRPLLAMSHSDNTDLNRIINKHGAFYITIFCIIYYYCKSLCGS